MFWKEKKAFYTINKYVLCSRKMGYFPKGLKHDFGQKKNFLHCLFLLKIGVKMIFRDVLARKEAFLDNKNMYLICPKNHIFSKRVNP